MKESLKILILEDSRDDADLIERELRRNGMNFTSVIVKKRKEFEDALKEFKPDVILSDHSLPQFNSIDALKLYHECRKELNLLAPFILITGSVSEEFAVQCIKAGADDYILKDRLKRLPSSILSTLKKAKIERERIKFLDEIISNEAMMREAEQLAHFGSFQVDLISGKHKWSDEGYRIFGYDPGDIEISYETFINHIHPEDKPSFQKAIDNMILHHVSYSNEFRIIDRNGKVKNLFSSILVKRNDNQEAIRITGFNLDITEQKTQTEALALQNKKLMEIAWMQSHEVRAPLARMMGLINLIQLSQVDHLEIKEILNNILISANELDLIIRKIVRKTEEIEAR